MPAWQDDDSGLELPDKHSGPFCFHSDTHARHTPGQITVEFLKPKDPAISVETPCVLCCHRYTHAGRAVRWRFAWLKLRSWSFFFLVLTKAAAGDGDVVPDGDAFTVALAAGARGRNAPARAEALAGKLARDKSPLTQPVVVVLQLHKDCHVWGCSAVRWTVSTSGWHGVPVPAVDGPHRRNHYV